MTRTGWGYGGQMNTSDVATVAAMFWLGLASLFNAVALLILRRRRARRSPRTS